MSLSLASHILFTGENVTIVRVQSSKCHYRVGVDEDCITVYGPGVEHEVDSVFHKINNYPPEAQAIMAVLLFEEEE